MHEDGREKMETSKAKGRSREVGMTNLAFTCNRQYFHQEFT